MKNREMESISSDCDGLTVMASVAVSQAGNPGGGGGDGGGGRDPGLLNAFKSGIEQSLALMNQMSVEDRAAAYKTLALLCGESNLPISFQDDPSSPTNEHTEETDQLPIMLPETEISTVACDNDTPKSNTDDNEVHIEESAPQNGTSSKPVTRERSQRIMAKKNASPPTPPKSTAKRPRKTKAKDNKSKQKEGKKIPEDNNNLRADPDKAESDSDSKSDSFPSSVSQKLNEDATQDGDKVFTCETCGKKLKSRFSLLVHTRTHTGEKPYPCHLCNKSFSCSNNCRRHIRETHEGARPFNCSRCQSGFFRQLQLEKHLMEDHDLSAGEIKEEQQKHVTKKEFYDCKDCGKLFKTKSNLRVHEAVHTEERQYACPHCDKKFSFRTNLKRHVMLHTGVRPHHCETCNKGFIEFKSLKLHISREHGGPDMGEPDKFTCEECGKQLSTRTSLINHKLTHTGSKPHMCPLCDKAFSIKSNLKRHIRAHDNDRPWECPKCSKRFTEKKSMEVHFRIHTGERPYSCSECGKSFAQASTLQAHMPVHNKERGVSCEICNKSFLRKSHYRFHMYKHTHPPKYKCVDCPRAFYRKTDLSRHRLTHTGERPYHCTLCPKQFSRQLYLKDHLNQHLGQRPYTCPHCPATYAESSARVKHMRRCPMRVTTKPPVEAEEGLNLKQEKGEGVNQVPLIIQPGNVVVSGADLDIVTTAMTSASLSPLTITAEGLIMDSSGATEVTEQQQVTAAADNLVALANSGVIALQGTTIDLAGLTADKTQLEVTAPPLSTEVTTFEQLQQLGLQAVDVNDVREVHVQDVDTEAGRTKHYIVVLQSGPVPQ